ncbi:MAG: AraC family ligand binding domain-containing protein [Anaerolinea sp.]|nr:AraC family ligand binding domain-containing protein [Anaerolinea sp.]
MAIHEPGVYAGMDEAAINEQVSRQGHTARKVEEPPGAVYDNHKNAHDLVLAFVRGSAEIRIGEETFHVAGGDRLNIPGDQPHSARVGADGVTYYMTQVVNEGS